VKGANPTTRCAMSLLFLGGIDVACMLRYVDNWG
jgi:hypothetical protein